MASAYLTRTPGSAGNRKTWTLSGWYKRSGNAADYLLSSGQWSTTQLSQILFEGDDYFNVAFYSSGCLLYTSPSPRDATLSRMPSSA